MVQIAMLVCGTVAGLKAKTWRWAIYITLAAFAVVLVPQTIAVGSDANEDLGFLYWLIQAVSLAIGLGIARVLITRRERRHSLAG